MKHVVQFAGANMDNVAAVVFCLELVSTCVVHLLSSKWAAAPTDGEQTLVVKYCDGSVRPDKNNVFPSVNISTDFKDCTGPLLKHGDVSELFVCLLKFCTGTNEIEKHTSWRAHFGLSDSVGPEWRELLNHH